MRLGILKRMRGTPISIGSYIGGIIGSVHDQRRDPDRARRRDRACPSTISTFPYHPAAALLTLLVGIVTFSSLGLAVTVIVPNADAAPAVINGIYFPDRVHLGRLLPVEQRLGPLRIADYFPIRHMITSLVSAFESGPGSGLRVGDLLVMLLWAAAGLVVTARRFRWEPRRPR